MSRRYALEFAPKALRALRKLDRPVVERIKAATESLRDDPRPAGAKMLTGMHGILRIRVAGDYRVLYTVDDDRLVVLVVDAGHRRQIYRLASWPAGRSGYVASITRRRAELAGRLWDLSKTPLGTWQPQ